MFVTKVARIICVFLLATSVSAAQAQTSSEVLAEKLAADLVDDVLETEVTFKEQSGANRQFYIGIHKHLGVHRDMGITISREGVADLDPEQLLGQECLQVNNMFGGFSWQNGPCRYYNLVAEQELLVFSCEARGRSGGAVFARHRTLRYTTSVDPWDLKRSIEGNIAGMVDQAFAWDSTLDEATFTCEVLDRVRYGVNPASSVDPMQVLQDWTRAGDTVSIPHSWVALVMSRGGAYVLRSGDSEEDARKQALDWCNANIGVGRCSQTTVSVPNDWSIAGLVCGTQARHNTFVAGSAHGVGTARTHALKKAQQAGFAVSSCRDRYTR